jgi:hypothetical protein
MNKNKFKCIEMKDHIQQKIYEDIKDLSAKEEIEYFKNKAKKGIFSHLIKKDPNKKAA